MLQGPTTRETRDGAREVKYLVTPQIGAEVLDWARTRLPPDPYAGGDSGDEYLTTSLYFDTADYAVYRRRGSYRRSKYRIRRYGSSDVVFLERKLRTATLLSKRRTAIPIADLAKLDALAGDPAWAGHWFDQRIRARLLAPVSQVAYLRHARVGSGQYGPMRLTFDNEMAVQPSSGFGFEPPKGSTVLGASMIVEMKYCVEMPSVFNEIVMKFRLAPAAISKYRLTLEVLRDAGARTGPRRDDLRAVLAGLPSAPADAPIASA
jgi:hypothetical protein